MDADYLRFLLSLLFVLGLILLFAWIARRTGLGFRIGPLTRGRAADRRLHIVEIAPLDVRRKLVLLRRDDREHLVLLGANSDIVIESGIAAPQDADTRVEEREDRT